MYKSKEEVNQIKKNYPVGTRLELISTNDPYTKLPSGTKGTVAYIDDIGTLHMNWENGSTLGMIVGEDLFKKI